MLIDVVLTPEELSSRSDIADKNTLVIDVLRATTTVSYAFNAGCSEIIPVESRNEAENLYLNSDKSHTLITGERCCQKIEGYDLGNSPQEYTQEKVKGKSIIFTTSNGTKAINRVKNCRFIAAASFVNATAAAKKVLQQNGDILILCAGRDKTVSGEDTCCAGFIVETLQKSCTKKGVSFSTSDGADIALKYYQHNRTNILGLISSTTSGKSISADGFYEDIKACAQVDLFNLVPVLVGGVLKVTG